MEMTMNIVAPSLECNSMILVQHQGKYFFTLYDENHNEVVIPIPILDENQNIIRVDSAIKVECDDNLEIHLNFSLPSGFYYIKVFFEDSFQHGIIFQRINLG